MKNSGHSHIAGYSGDISLSSKGNIPISCKKLGTGEARIYSVATFYENFPSSQRANTLSNVVTALPVM